MSVVINELTDLTNLTKSFFITLSKSLNIFLLYNKIDTKVIILTIKDTRITVKFDRQTNL